MVTGTSLHSTKEALRLTRLYPDILYSTAGEGLWPQLASFVPSLAMRRWVVREVACGVTALGGLWWLQCYIDCTIKHRLHYTNLLYLQTFIWPYMESY